MSELATVEAIASRASDVRERVAAVGGDPEAVTVVAVTKVFPPEVVRRALAAGITDIGESYAQELVAKADWLEATQPETPPPRWHFVGGLQRNKVKLLAGRVHLWHSVDRPALVDEIAKRSPGDRILIQVNTTAEPTKEGCAPAEAQSLVERGRERGLTVAGLMTLGPTGGGDPRAAFAQLRALAQRCEVSELSMGMTGDFEIAVEEGATMIRLGTLLFGPRPTGRTTAAG